MTEKEYWDEIKSLAESVTEEAKEYSRELSEVLWETIDGHEWVIYTARNFEVLAISPSDGAYIENFGPEGIVKDGVLNTAILTYAAMEQDIQNHYAFED